MLPNNPFQARPRTMLLHTNSSSRRNRFELVSLSTEWLPLHPSLVLPEWVLKLPTPRARFSAGGPLRRRSSHTRCIHLLIFVVHGEPHGPNLRDYFKTKGEGSNRTCKK